MNFDAILTYQSKDEELIALENTMAKSLEFVAFNKAKGKLDAATTAVGKLSQEASEILSSHDRFAEKAEELTARLDEFNGVLEVMHNVNEADYYIRQISAISNEIAALEKELAREENRIKGIDSEYKLTWNQGVKALEEYKEATAVYKQYYMSVKPMVDKLTTELRQLEKEVQPDIMKTYLSLRAAKKMPAFVAYRPDTGSCGRCFMEVAGDTRSKLRNPGDYAECPNCRRILYVPEQ